MEPLLAHLFQNALRSQPSRLLATLKDTNYAVKTNNELSGL